MHNKLCMFCVLLAVILKCHFIFYFLLHNIIATQRVYVISIRERNITISLSYFVYQNDLFCLSSSPLLQQYHENIFCKTFCFRTKIGTLQNKLKLKLIQNIQRYCHPKERAKTLFSGTKDFMNAGNNFAKNKLIQKIYTESIANTYSTLTI